MENNEELLQQYEDIISFIKSDALNGAIILLLHHEKFELRKK